MTRREALHKATITTTDAATGLLPAEAARKFVVKIKEANPWGQAIRQEIRTSSAGEIDKLSTGARIIRRATENADDGYRAGATFSQISYSSVKVRLPWEVTEDVFHENIEGDELETTITNDMTEQFGLDVSDLEVNGDTAAGAGPDQAFLQINDGLLKLAIAGNGTHVVDGSAINAGVINKAHYFAALRAMPNKYRQGLRGRLRWFMSPNQATNWWEQVTNRVTAAGDAALGSPEGTIPRGPLGIPIVEVPALPDSTMFLAEPRNFIRVVTWQIRRRRVTGETDAELAAKDKRFYVYHLKHDFVIEEQDAVVRVNGLVP